MTTTVHRLGYLGTIQGAQDIVTAFRDGGVTAARVSGWNHPPGPVTVDQPMADTRRGWLVRRGAEVSWRVEGDRSVVTVVSEQAIDVLTLEPLGEITVVDGPVLGWMDASAGVPPVKERTYWRDGDVVARRLIALGDDGQELS